MDVKVLLSRLKELNLADGKYAVFGSGPLAVRGILPAVLKNLDIIVTEDLWEILAKEYLTDEEGFIRTRGLKFSNWWWRKVPKFEKLIAEADIIDGVRFVKLEEVYKYKRQIMGPKEREHLKAIEEYFKKENLGELPTS